MIKKCITCYEKILRSAGIARMPSSVRQVAFFRFLLIQSFLLLKFMCIYFLLVPFILETKFISIDIFGGLFILASILYCLVWCIFWKKIKPLYLQKQRDIKHPVLTSFTGAISTLKIDIFAVLIIYFFYKVL